MVGTACYGEGLCSYSCVLSIKCWCELEVRHLWGHVCSRGCALLAADLEGAQLVVGAVA